MSTPIRPPTEYIPPAPPPRQSRWPAVLGVIALVLAVLGVLGGCWTLLFAGLSSELGGVGVQHLWAQHPATMAVMGVTSILLGAALLMGAMGLLRRRAWSRRLLLGWALIQILVTSVAMTLHWWTAWDQIAAAPVQPGFPAGFTYAIMLLTLVMSLVVSIAPPVFVLIWFNRGKIRSEMRSWT